MTVLKKVKSHPDVIEYFKKLPFYNKHIKKPKIKQENRKTPFLQNTTGPLLLKFLVFLVQHLVSI